MMKKYLEILTEVSRLNITPYFKWTDKTKTILHTLLGNLNYFITPEGNVFIGESSIEEIKANSWCFQAHMDHPGGWLKKDEEQDFFYCTYNGQKKSSFMLGQRMGLFMEGDDSPFDVVDVQHVHGNRGDDITLYFTSDRIKKDLEKLPISVHHSQKPIIEDGLLKAWALDDLLNVAFLLHEAETMLANGFYILLTHNEEVGNKGLKGFLARLGQKSLNFVSLDVTSTENVLASPYGIREKQNGVELLTSLPVALKERIDHFPKGQLDSGSSEGKVIVESGYKCIPMYLQIDNLHNGVFYNQYTFESVEEENLKKYFTMLDELTNILSTIQIKEEVSSSKEKDWEVVIDSKVNTIINIFKKNKTFSGFISEGFSEFRACYTGLNLEIPTITVDNYPKVQEKMLQLESYDIVKEEVESYVVDIAKMVAQYFDISEEMVLNSISKVPIYELALCNFNACNHYVNERAIMISTDHVVPNDLKRLLIHELTHLISHTWWCTKNLSDKEQLMENEGLAVYVSKVLANKTLPVALGIKEEDYSNYEEVRTKLVDEAQKYIFNNKSVYHIGKFHKYYKMADEKNPFYSNAKYYPKYGYFVGHEKVREKMERGKSYE